MFGLMSTGYLKTIITEVNIFYSINKLWKHVFIFYIIFISYFNIS